MAKNPRKMLGDKDAPCTRLLLQLIEAQDKLNNLLNREEIPVPSIHDEFATSSTVSPFSDKLMMYLTVTMCAFAIGVDGAVIVSSMRPDLIATHTRFGAEIGKYSTEGTNIMISNRWLEQPPQKVIHGRLSTV